MTVSEGERMNTVLVGLQASQAPSKESHLKVLDATPFMSLRS